MKEFRIQPAHIEKAGKRLFYILTPLALFVIGIEIYYLSQLWGLGGGIGYLPLVLIPLVAIYFGTSSIRSVKRQKKQLEDYRIFLDEEQITLRRSGNFTHSIGFMEIREITKTPKGNFIVKGEGKGSVIIVSSKMEDYEELEGRLQKLGTITVRKNNNMLRFRLVLLIFFVAALIAFNVTENKWVVGITGPLVIGGLLTLFYYRLIDKTIPQKMKLKSWWLLAGAAFFGYLLYTKLSA